MTHRASSSGSVAEEDAPPPRVAEPAPRRPMVSRTALNFMLDAALLGLFAALAWTIALFRFVFPPATTARGWMLWGLTYDAWMGVQFVLCCVFALAVLLHVMLHWSWVCGVITLRLSKWRGRPIRWDDGYQTIYGVATLIVLLHLVGGALFLAMLTVQPPS